MKKLFLFIIIIAILLPIFIFAAKPGFVTIWKTDIERLVYASTFKISLVNQNRTPNQITLPLVPDGIYDCVVNWGDGKKSFIDNYNNYSKTHIYDKPGTYAVKITGTITGWSFNNRGDSYKLLDITHWGPFNFGPGAMSAGTFFGCQNLEITAEDVPDLSQTTSLSLVFLNCSNGKVWNIGSWDTSNITDMTAMFYKANSFNADLSSWDTSHVISMKNMFSEAFEFNCDLSSWDVSKVTDMSFMFSSARSFNSDLGSWDTSNVKSMWAMFSGAELFNCDLSTWDTSKVTNMNAMFGNAAAFNGDISTWDTSNVNDMGRMFCNTTAFNGNISSWKTSWVSKMYEMFANASSFNQDISSWDTSKVENMVCMFESAKNFDQDLSAWKISNVQSMQDMFVNVTLSTANYNAILISWAPQPIKKRGVLYFHGGNSKYSSGKAAEARQHMRANGWVIYDGGMVQDTP